MSLGGFFSSDSEATHTQVAADNQGQAGSGSNQADDQSVVIAPGKKGVATYVSPNSVNISGSNLTDNANRGIKIESGAKVNDVIVGDTASQAQLVTEFAGLVKNLSDSQSDALKQLIESQREASRELDEELGTSVQTNPPGPAAGSSGWGWKLGIVAGLGLLLWWWND